MGKYEQLAKDIIKNVGGKENICGLTHCITRLRFQLKDESKAKDDVLKAMEGVVTVMKSGGQYQVVIGNHVPFVFADVCEVAGITESTQGGDAPKGIFNRLIDIISGCFQPVLGAMCAAGMIKGLNALLIFLNAYTADSGTYMMLNAIGDCVFYFMPVLIGYTSAKKFNLNPMVGMVIGAALCYPTIQASAIAVGDPIGTLLGGTFAESAYYKTFLNIPFIANNYTSSVIPVILVVAFAGQVQKIGKKIIPEMLQNFFVPFFVLLISLPVGFLVIGPIITVLTGLLGAGFSAVNAFSPVLMGILVGFFWQTLVIFGLHWSLIPLMLVNLSMYGYDTALVGMYGATFAQTAVVMAMFFKFKDMKMKSLCIPAVISGICGVTEPAIYGITLPKKTPFVFSLIGGAAGGAVMGLMSAKAYVSGGLGIFGVVNYINTATGDASGMYASFVCIIVSMVVSFALTFFFWKDKSVVTSETVREQHINVGKEIVKSPMKGNIIALSSIKDDAFAQGAMGKGIAIEPGEGKVVAPFTGTIMTLFPTKHAIGLVSDHGMEVLIHIGLDTVQLNGKYFEAHVKQGDHVTAGQTLITFDINAIKKEGYCLQTPVIITNTKDYLDLVETQESHVNCNDDIITALL